MVRTKLTKFSRLGQSDMLRMNITSAWHTALHFVTFDDSLQPTLPVDPLPFLMSISCSFTGTYKFIWPFLDMVRLLSHLFAPVSYQ